MAAKRARFCSTISLSPASDSSFSVSASTCSALLEADTRHVFACLKLLPEIRNRIYDLVFVSDRYIGANGTQTKAFYRDAARYRCLAFASACRQIYEESANIFYAKNGFEFFYIKPFLEFLEAIGAERRKLLTKLRYSYTNGTPFIVLRYLKSCTNLQELEVFVRVVMPGRQNSWWLYPLEDAKCFFLGSSKLVKFGDVRKVGKAESASDEPPQARVAKAKAGLVQSLAKVKGEESGQYTRYTTMLPDLLVLLKLISNNSPDLPNVFTSGHCAWGLSAKTKTEDASTIPTLPSLMIQAHWAEVDVEGQYNH